MFMSLVFSRTVPVGSTIYMFANAPILFFVFIAPGYVQIYSNAYIRCYFFVPPKTSSVQLQVFFAWLVWFCFLTDSYRELCTAVGSPVPVAGPSLTVP